MRATPAGGPEPERSGQEASGPTRGDDMMALLERLTELPASEVHRAVEVAGEALGATAAVLLVADYGLTSLQAVGAAGPTGAVQPVEGTLAGRAFSRREVVVSEHDESTVWIPVADESERLGVLELVHPAWTDDVLAEVDRVVRLLMLVLVSKRRYTDTILRARRSQPLSLAAEMQWDLLPPLSCTTDRVSVSGILEPAYSIGGDSFDYAMNPGHVEFVILDAVGHGIGAVSIAAVVVNCLRNARREGAGLEAGYLQADAAVRAQFTDAAFATAQVGSLDQTTGELAWINAGHPLPMLIRDRTFVGPLECAPSIPIGFGGSVAEIAVEVLQPGDRVLFFTDGVIETRGADGEEFGTDRLGDFLARAALDGVPAAETVRRLAGSIKAFAPGQMRDDATLLMLELRGPAEP